MPDHPAATGDTAGDTVTDTAAEAPVPSEAEISRRMRLRARWLTIIGAVATLVAASAVSVLVPNQTRGRYVDAVAIERQGDEEEVPSGGTASFTARLAAPSDKVGLVVGLQPADAPVTCEPRSVDVVVRAAGVPGGAWRQRYPGRLGPTFEAGVRVSERAETVSVAVTPHAGTQAGACAYKPDLLVVESARTPLLWVTLLGAGIAVVGGLVVALLVYLRRDVLRRPPWLGPAAGMQRARARERAAERAIEDALRHGRGRPPEPRWPADDEALEPVAGTDGTREAGGTGQWSGPVAGSDALVLADLWTVTHARLDKYHGIAQTQARHAFRNAQLPRRGAAGGRRGPDPRAAGGDPRRDRPGHRRPAGRDPAGPAAAAGARQRPLTRGGLLRLPAFPALPAAPCLPYGPGRARHGKCRGTDLLTHWSSPFNLLRNRGDTCPGGRVTHPATRPPPAAARAVTAGGSRPSPGVPHLRIPGSRETGIRSRPPVVGMGRTTGRRTIRRTTWRQRT